MLLSTSCSLKFTVTRKNVELVHPAKPTPHECKLLSDIDDQEGLRIHLPTIQFFRRRDPSLERIDPVKVIRDSLAQALVFYYPLAGRLCELPGRKLMVECTGEGVLFIEADAHVKLEEFWEDGIHPPYIPCLDQLIYDVPGSSGIVNSPLMLIQVTRLICGGFTLAIRFNHTMLDGFGLLQFITAMSEIASGAIAPSVLPVWQRELLSSRHPPRITHVHPEFDQLPDDSRVPGCLPEPGSFITQSFFFGPEEISTLRKLLSLSTNNSQKLYSSFDLVAACVWRCRTIALEFDPSDEVRFLCLVRPRMRPRLPAGYYGNSFVYSTAITTAGELVGNNIEFGAELISSIKSKATTEYLQSVADFMVLKGRPPISFLRTYAVSDNSRIINKNVDFGWGNGGYGGVACIDGALSDMSFYIPFDRKNNNGHFEKGILVPISLSIEAMKRFEEELGIMLNNGDKFDIGRNRSVTW